MKKILFLVILSSSMLLGSEPDVLKLLIWQNKQSLASLVAMAAVGIHGLVQNSDQICSTENPYCWKVIAPLVSVPLISGYLIYKGVTIRIDNYKRIV